MRKIGAAIAAGALLVHCGPSRETSQPSSASLLRGGAAELLARAKSAPRVHAAGFDFEVGKTIARVPRWSGSPFVIENVGVSVEAPASLGDVDGKSIVFAHGNGQRTLVFALAHALEALVRLERPSNVSFDLKLPEGATARRVGDVIAIADHEGRALLHVTADRGWDANGKEFFVDLSLEGSHLRLRVPKSVAYPIAIDPTFSPATSPLRLRRKHTATLLGSGEVLIAGGVGTSSAEIFDAFTGRFRAAESMKVAREGHAATLLADGRVLLVGNSATDSTAEVYDPAKGTFTSVGSMTTGRSSVSLARLSDGKVMVTGYASTTAELFDPSTNTFSAIAGPHPGGHSVNLANGDTLFLGDGLGANTAAVRNATTGAMTTLSGAPTELGKYEAVALPDGRAWAVAVAAKALFPDGSFSYSMDAYLIDPVAKTFTQSPAPFGGSTPRPVLLPTGKVALVNEFQMQEFDPATNTYVTYGYTSPDPRKAPAMTDRHGDHTTTLLPNGDMFVLGGDGAVELLMTQDESATYDNASLGIMRVAPQATQLLDGKVLFSGGTDVKTGAAAPEIRSTAEIFDPSTKTAGALANMQEARVGHAQVLLPSGKVLIAGGSSSTAELFDPSTNSSTATGSMSVARAHASAVLLPGGKALVVGGDGSTAEIFDEKTGTFTATGSMVGKHANQSLFLLPTGKVLVFDGAGAELYDPRAGTFASAGSPVGSSREVGATAMLGTGNVVTIGGPSGAADIYDAVTGTFTLGGTPDELRTYRKLTSLANGKVLAVGGYSDLFGLSQRGYVFDPLANANKGAFQLLYPGAPRGFQHALVGISTGGAISTDGNPCAPFCPVGPPTHVNVYHPVPLAAPRPLITSAPASVVAGSTVTISGTSLVAPLDGSTHSSTRSPVAIWVPASGSGQVMGAITAATATSATWRVPVTALYGKGWLHLVTNGTLSKGFPVEITAATNGATCTNATQCASGFCVDGVCCDTACVGACNACTKARKGSGEDGTCAPIPPEKDATDACSISAGAPCKSGAECATGFCSDGVCCDGACTGQCEACNVEGSFGNCVAQPSGKAPAAGHPACTAATDKCATAYCDGVTRDACKGLEPSTTTCRAGSCTDGVETFAASCDGKGACPAPSTKKCEPFVCGIDKCLDKCAVDADCVANSRCVAGECVNGAYCDGDHTVLVKGGAATDCTPYRCEGATCKTACGTSADCLGGYVCDNGACITPSLGSTDSGGCSYGARVGGVAWMGLLIAIGALRGGRRSRLS